MSKKAYTKAEKAKPEIDALESLFTPPQTEEPSESTDSPSGCAAPSNTPDPKKDEITSLPVQLEDLHEEEMFKIWCFPEDMHGIRCFLYRIWADHRAGLLGFPDARYTTDIAFILASNRDIAFENKYSIFNQEYVSVSVDILNVNFTVREKRLAARSSLHSVQSSRLIPA